MKVEIELSADQASALQSAVWHVSTEDPPGRDLEARKRDCELLTRSVLLAWLNSLPADRSRDMYRDEVLKMSRSLDLEPA